MKIEIPDTPLGAIRAVRYLLGRYRIEIGLLNIHPATFYEMMEDPQATQSIFRAIKENEKDEIENIPFKMKLL